MLGSLRDSLSAGASRFTRFLNQRSVGSSNISSDETVLVVAHSSYEEWFFETLPTEPTVVVASDNMSTQDLAEQSHTVDSVVHVSQMESYYSISDEALELTGAVNDWFENLSERVGGLPQLTHFWHPEWGNGRTIEQAILLINSYHTLLERHRPDHVIYTQSQYRWLEWTVLQSVLEEHNCTSVPLVGFRTRVLKRMGLDPKTTGFERLLSLPLIRFLVSVRSNLELLSRLVRKRVNWFCSAILGGNEQKQSQETTLAFQLLTDSNRHISALLSQMEPVDAIDGLEPVAPCWNASNGATRIQAEGLPAVELESLYPLRRLPADMSHTVRTWVATRRQISSIYDYDLSYRGVSLHNIVRPLIRRYVWNQTFESFTFSVGLKQFLHTQSIDGFQSMGGGYHNQLGALSMPVAESTTDLFPFFYRGNPRYHYNPYFLDLNDQYFANGQKESERLSLQGIEPERRDTVYYTRFDNIRAFYREHSRQDSLEHVGLSDAYEYTLFFAPQWVIPGRLTEQELSLVTETLFDFASTHEDCQLVVKPHPNDHSAILQTLYQSYTAPNIELLDSGIDALHCVNCSDIVLTKFSTVGLEAIICEKALVTVAIDEGGKTYLTPYEDVAETFRELDAMVAFLETIDTDSDYRHEWFQEQAERRERFIEQNVTSMDDLGVALERMLGERGLLNE